MIRDLQNGLAVTAPQWKTAVVNMRSSRTQPPPPRRTVRAYFPGKRSERRGSSLNQANNSLHLERIVADATTQRSPDQTFSLGYGSELLEPNLQVAASGTVKTLKAATTRTPQLHR